MSQITNHKLKIGIIGCGNMGSALVENLRKVSKKDIFVFDKDRTRAESLVNRFGVVLCRNINELKKYCGVFIVAVKPQDIDPVLEELSDPGDKLIISIAAGITLGFLETRLGKNAMIVRSMPNLNAMIAKSVTALCANKAVSSQDMSLAKEIFLSVGKVVFAEDSQMNGVTAVSGSGPAFVAYLYPDLSREQIKSVLEKEAIGFGLSKDNASIMADATIDGTLEMIKTNLDASMLIKRVSSKGGTTEAGMKVLLEKGKSEEALSAAIKAAEARAGELARRQ